MEDLVFHSSEEEGAKGAERKAWLLNRESGYNIVSIEHRTMPVARPFAKAQNSKLGRNWLGYIITVKKPTPELFSNFIPKIIEA